MAKITMTLSAKVDKQTKKAEILFRFVGSSTIILRAKSGIFIYTRMWNAKKNELKTATFGEEERELQKRLVDLCSAIKDSFVATDKEQVNKEWLNTTIDKFHHPEKYEPKEEEIQKQTFFEVFDKFLIVRKLSDVRERNFRVLYRTLQRYEIYRGKPLDLDTETDDTIRDIHNFIANEYKLCEEPRYQKILAKIPEARTPQPRGHNTMSATFTKLRTFWKWCVETKETTNHPTIKVEEEIYGTPFYITIEERKQIERTNLSRHPHLAIQRDIFVFQCCIGCRVGDLIQYTPDNIVNGALEYIPRKTKDGRPITVKVPLNSTANNILERYKGIKREPLRSRRVEGDLLPFISEQKYNDSLKLIFKAARINRVIQWLNPLTGDVEPRPLYEVASSHLARRTFVGNMYKKVKDPNLVGSMSGHKEGSKAFARYREIDDEMKKDLVNLID